MAGVNFFYESTGWGLDEKIDYAYILFEQTGCNDEK
jgi:hypothetical protein